jgi:hypothetical protein
MLPRTSSTAGGEDHLRRRPWAAPRFSDHGNHLSMTVAVPEEEAEEPEQLGTPALLRSPSSA